MDRTAGNLNILLVEDVESDQLLILDEITDQVGADVNVEIAASVAEGLKALSQASFDVVLLDLQLPDSHGIDTVATFRAAQNDAPVVVLTGSTKFEDSRLAVRVGADEVIAKDELNNRDSTLWHSMHAAIDRHERLRREERALDVDDYVNGVLGVLLVEDDPASAALAISMLEEVGLSNGWRLDMTTATSLQEVRAYVEAGGRPVITLLDLNLPDSAGLNTLVQVTDILGATTIVVLSGDDRDLHAMTALDLGATDVLVKDWTDARTLNRAISFGLRRRRRERQIAVAAMHDRLTGLPSRSLILERLNESLEQVRTGELDSVGVLFLDLAGFPQVNEQFGHDTGDLVLRVVAGRMSALARGTDTLGRLGGDEFALITHNLSHLDCEALIGRMADAVGAPIALDEEYRVIVGLNGGVGWTDQATSATHLLREADRAMFVARRLAAAAS